MQALKLQEQTTAKRLQYSFSFIYILGIVLHTAQLIFVVVAVKLGHPSPKKSFKTNLRKTDKKEKKLELPERKPLGKYNIRSLGISNNPVGLFSDLVPSP